MTSASLVALASLGLLFIGVYAGWLGPDVGRGANFCEAPHAGCIKQPANTWSNLGFVIAGLAIAVRLRSPEGLTGTFAQHPTLPQAYAILVVLLGPASMAMHATQSSLGGLLDLASMYLVAAFIAGYALMRLLERGPGFLAGAFVAVVALCQLAGLWTTEIPVVMYAGNVAFAFFLALGLGVEVVLVRQGLVVHGRWAAGAVACMAVAFAIWSQAKTGSRFCLPDSIIQGHAVWHLLCAAATYCLFRYYASESSRDDGRRK